MYLIVFVFLMISILGLYTQVYAAQAARMFASQKGVAETMMLWHNLASMAIKRNGVVPPPVGSGCYMTPGVTGTACSHTLTTADLNNAGTTSNIYNAANYQWMTIYFKSTGGQNVLLTYVAPDTANKSMALTPAVGFTTYEIYRQIQGLSLSNMRYSWVSTTTPRTVTVGGGVFVDSAGNRTYQPPTTITLPTTPAIAAKSVALVSYL